MPLPPQMHDKTHIINADCLWAMEKMAGDCVDLVITSPPYNLGVDYDGSSDLMPEQAYLAKMKRVWQECHRVMTSGGRLCINIGENKRQDITIPTFSAFTQQCAEIGMLYRGTIIWSKNNAAKHCAWGSWKSPSNPHLVPRHEYIIVFSKDTYKNNGEKENADITADEFCQYTNTIWNIGTESAKRVNHPAPFPVELAARLIKLYTFKNQTVLDPFCGSGTTCVAAKKLKRYWRGIEVSKKYCDIARERIAAVQ